MKKIMFNDRYGLTQAVLQGRKTMTRRLLKVPFTELNDLNCALKDSVNLMANKIAIIKKYSKYQIGEEVAVLQSYNDIFKEADNGDYWADCYERYRQAQVDDKPGWNNKMFVLAYLMPHRIRITDIKLERLQDISDEDCIKEGIIRRDDVINSNMENIVRYWFEGSFEHHISKSYTTARQAFSVLIDKVCKHGTWRKNPFVLAYSFELVQ